MFAKRELFCGLCGCENYGYLNNKKILLRCINHKCNASIKATFDNQNIISNYRYLNGKPINTTKIYCENCSRAIKLEFDNNNKFKYVCECGNSIYIKNSHNGDLHISNKLEKS